MSGDVALGRGCFQQRVREMLSSFRPLPVAMCALGGVLIPGKAVPQPADAGCTCQVNEMFIRATAGYSLLSKQVGRLLGQLL